MIDLTKTYSTRDGRKVTGLHLRNPNHAYPFAATLDGQPGYTFTPEGFWVEGDTNDEDLIAFEEAPAASTAQTVPESYYVGPIRSTMFDDFDEAVTAARQNIEPGETIGIFKAMAVLVQPDVPAAVLTVAPAAA